MKKFAVPIVVLLGCLGASAQETTTMSYTQTNLVSDVPALTTIQDPNLVNPWGLARTAGSPWWVADTGTGVATSYTSTGTIESRVVTIPTATGTGTGSPTGAVAWGSDFVFVTLDGTISEWTTGTTAALKVNNSSVGAVYTGCTLATYDGALTLYVANSAGGVEAYSSTFTRVTLPSGAFVDPNVPAGYTPYGIQYANGEIWVTFADGVGAGDGYVDAFNPSGTLLLSLEHGNWMNEPWGIALAPADFGEFSGDILVANTGSGEIGAFKATTGTFAGFLKNSAGTAIKNSGLWAIYFGAGNTASGPTTTLFFTAGLDDFKRGLFGSITAN